MLLPRWRERLNLLASRDDRLVGRIELSKLADQAIRHLEGLGLVEHEVAQEGIEVAEVLGRLGFVQQTQRHFALDAEQTTEPFAIGTKFVAGKRLGERLFELSDVEVGLAEVLQLAQVKGPLHDKVVAFDVGASVRIAPQPEHLNQHHRLTQRILVGQRQGRPSRPRAQVAGRDLSRLPILLFSPRTTYVGDEVPVTATAVRLARSSVEIDPARWRQQRRKRIEKRRLPCAGSTHKQKASFADRHVVQAGESTPVVNLQAGHPELLAGKQGGGLGFRDHWSASSSASV